MKSMKKIINIILIINLIFILDYIVSLDFESNLLSIANPLQNIKANNIIIIANIAINLFLIVIFNTKNIKNNVKTILIIVFFIFSLLYPVYQKEILIEKTNKITTKYINIYGIKIYEK